MSPAGAGGPGRGAGRDGRGRAAGKGRGPGLDDLRALGDIVLFVVMVVAALCMVGALVFMVAS